MQWMEIENILQCIGCWYVEADASRPELTRGAPIWADERFSAAPKKVPYFKRGCTCTGHEVAMATKFFTVTPNICVISMKLVLCHLGTKKFGVARKIS
jgi:hypothetical protein